MVNRIKNSLSPEGLRELSLRDLDLLSYEIRDFLIEHVSKTGGHLASNLGVVELTIAIHRVFNTPDDKIIWDVGHQSYVHKILTGRGSDFDTLRQTGGLSGFPKRSESEYDCYDSGHSSSSISAAFGMATARDLSGDNYDVIAVIGDGALTGGMAYEALNNAGASDSKIIVILNDNGMSISKNTGSMSKHLSTLRTSEAYLNFKRKVKSGLKKIPNVGDSIYKGAEGLKESLKFALVDGGAVFEELGFTYLGPINGNDINATIETLKMAKRAEGPVLVHVTTQKGKGYKNAENNPNMFHGVGPFDQLTGKSAGSNAACYSDIFGKKLCELAERDKTIVGVCAAMMDGTGLSEFGEKYPRRFFDAGIAEEHAVTFAAGMALSEYKPFVAIYSTFLQRAYDQILIDVCMQNLPVIFAVDRAGNVGNDGETHQGIFDISYLSSMPNMTLLAPSDGKELEEMMEYALTLNGPCAIRYPRGKAPDLFWESRQPFSGKSVLLKEGRDVEIWAAGKMVETALLVSEGIKEKGFSVGVVNAGILNPFDQELLKGLPARAERLVTLEDNIVSGGFGQGLAAFLAAQELKVPVKNMGWPMKFIEHGNTEDLFEKYGLSSSRIIERICEFIEKQA